MLRIALPLVLAEVGWMLMGIVDTMMVGRLPNAAVAMSSVALAQIFYNTLAFGLGGILLGLDTVISQAHGAGRFDEANRWLLNGLVLASVLSVLLTAIFLIAPAGMLHMRTTPEVITGAVATLHALTLGIFPLLLYFTFRRYLQAFNHVRIIAAALVTANLVNLLFDWLLIYGHSVHLHLGGASLSLGWSPLGVMGSGLATSFARIYQAVFLGVALWWVDRRRGYGLRQLSLRPERQLISRLLGLGLPAGATLLVEISIFAVVTFLIGSLGPLPLAGHEIALNCVSFTFMVPLGLSAAASVRVGQAIGRRDKGEARAAGWAAMLFSAGFMLCTSALYLLFPHAIARVFTPDAAVIAATAPIFAIAAVFQLFDGLQVTAMGALRGAGDTHSGLITHLCSYWLVGLPLGIYLCFPLKLGARGLWMGLCLALVIAGIVLVLRWRSMTHRFPEPVAAAEARA